jgi:citrate synthase
VGAHEAMSSERVKVEDQPAAAQADAASSDGAPGAGNGAPAQSLTVIDNRTGKTYALPVTDGTIRAVDLRQIKVDPDEFGLMSYDPAYMNTASARSSITYIDGDRGILEHRGYSIESLCEHSSYLEVAYLLINGSLPTRAQLDEWVGEITIHTFVHENVKSFMQGFRYDANPMGMLVASVGALSTFYPDANRIDDEAVRMEQIIRLLAKMPTLAAFAFRHNAGQPYVYPDNELGYAGNFLGMMYKMTELKYEPDPRLERALDVLFILHADHEQNASTSAVRSVGSTHVDPYTAVAAGVAALYGPLHGGANEAALRMLARIGSVENIPGFLDGVKAGKERLMGFGHRVYKNYDPRARIIRKHLDAVFEVRGKSPLLEVATELEKRALDDDYFTSRKLYPNVDFYSGLIYEALGLPVAMFPVMFAIGRTSGWIAQWLEMVTDPEQKIARPRQIYTGEREREYVPIDERG